MWTLFVAGASGAISQLVDTVVLLGQDTTLYCRNSDHTSGFEQWSDATNTPSSPFASRSGGVQRGAGFEKYVNFDLESTAITQLGLKINSAELEDEGTYACTLSPDTGSATLSVESEWTCKKAWPGENDQLPNYLHQHNKLFL